MQANRRKMFSAFMLFCGWILTQSFATPLYAATVNYTGAGSGTLTSPFNSGGVTVTSSGTLYRDNSFGIGVVGGMSNQIIDDTESANFAFETGAATGVSFDQVLSECTNCSATPTVTVEGFGVGGASLGSASVSIFGLATHNISSLFGGVALSSFTIEGTLNNGLSVGSITFTPVAPIPEPSSLMLLGTGVLGVAGMLRRRLTA